MFYRALAWHPLAAPLLLFSFATLLLQALRPINPIDETRYMAVAWEMWQAGSWLVPLLNGEPYSHKPPLLFWLIHAGWAIFGVQDVSARLVGTAFWVGVLYLTWRIGCRLWPDSHGRQAAVIGVWLLLAMLYPLGFASMIMFDALVTFFVLLGLWGLLQIESGRRIGWVWLALAVTGGGLAKGPFAVLFLVSLTVSAPWWMADPNGRMNHWRGRFLWWLRTGSVGLAGAAPVLLWAVLAASAGTPQYAEEILWGQMAGRVVDAFDHARPFWWYLPMLAVMLLPVLLWGPFVAAFGPRSLRSLPRAGVMLFWTVPPFVLLSLVSGKQPHYLLPMLPALALVAGAWIVRCDDSPVPARGVFALVAVLSLTVWVLPWFSDAYWAELLAGPGLFWALPLFLFAMGLFKPRSPTIQTRWIALVAAGLLITVHLVALPMRPTMDFRDFSKELAQLAEDGRPLAFVGKYRGEFHYHGRLESPVTVLPGATAIPEWCQSEPRGVVITVDRAAPQGAHLASTRFRSRFDVARSCDVVAGSVVGRGVSREG
ncbi:MAG: ArnT family glycosyltransferase [Halothiobacillaceae bacterium]